MRNLLAKFKVGSIVNFGNGNIEANLSAVTGDSEENKTFSKYTPSASLKIHITKEDALEFFKPSKEYIATFKEATDEKEPFCSVHNNSQEFEKWLTSKEIEWKSYGHGCFIFTPVDVFSLGSEWERYAMKNNPDYKK